MRKSWRTSDSEINRQAMTSKVVGPPSTVGIPTSTYLARRRVYSMVQLWTVKAK
jgi:hypothetical protein